MLHPGRVEGRAPAALVVARELEIEALARHPHGDVPDPGPGVEPGAERPEAKVIGRAREPGEAEGCSQDLAAWVEHGLLNRLVCRYVSWWRKHENPSELHAHSPVRFQRSLGHWHYVAGDQ
jgi:hypothetical protein